MVVKFIYPLTDVRPFLDEATHRIRVPAWAEPKPGNFVRDFGVVKVKRNWNHQLEEYFCTARQSLKIPGLRTLALPAGDNTLRPDRLVRRLYARWDDQHECFFNWVEVTLELTDPAAPDAGLRLSEANLIDLLGQLAQVEVRVPVFDEDKPAGKNKLKTYRLGNAGSALANLYLHSSSRYQAHPDLQKWWTRSGLPMVVVHCREDDLAGRPRQFQAVQKTGLAQLYLDYLRLPFNELFLHTWLLRSRSVDPKFEVGQHHRLQQRLSQLFTEYEHYKQIVQAIAYEQLTYPAFTEKANRLTGYLERSIDRLTRPEHFGVKQEEILAQLAPSYQDFLTPGELERLTQQLSTFRLNILRKAVNFTATGDKQAIPLDRLGRGLSDPARGAAIPDAAPPAAPPLSEQLAVLKTRIATDDPAAVFETVLSLTNRADDLRPYNNELILLVRTYRSLEQENRQSVISPNDYRASLNRLLLNLMNTLDTMITALPAAGGQR